MKYVLDASVAVKWTLQESDSDDARKLLDDIDAGLIDVAAPNTFPVEVAHALTKAERRGVIPRGEAQLGLTEVMTASVTLHDTLPLLTRAVELASEKRIGVYDCLYVALAEELDCERVTADVRLVNVFRDLSRIVLLSDL
ncbi:MAG: type II toxin-antitoxin system VapC family toxin [Planctomycetota bacterium]